MAVTEIKENIFWVGAIDWDIRDFHGYSTEKGTTYNSYLVKDEKNVLFDTVKTNFKDDLLFHIREVMDPTEIDYIVINHVELDHSGCLPEIIELVKPEKIICSPLGKKAMIDHFHREDWPFEVVKSGDTISLGKKSITFLETKMLHWPDSMLSYLPEDKLLISNDAFGQHFASTERFADEVSECGLLYQAEKYYANILTPFSALVQKVLATVAEMQLEIDMIAPDHGVIWRNNDKKVTPSFNVGTILDMYNRWSLGETSNKALVIYDTMWKSTAQMAKAIAGAISREGVSVQMMNLAVNHRSEIMTEVMDAKALVFGSPTLNNGILPRMADFLTYLKGLKPKNKVGAAFGSFGWSGEAVKHMTASLEDMGIEVVDPGLRVKYVPTEDNFAKCKELGKTVAKAMKK